MPIVPPVLRVRSGSGPQDRPEKLFRPKVPVTVSSGERIRPTLPTAELNGLLHSRMQHLLERAQELHGPHPAGSSGCRTGWAAGAPSLPRRRLARRRRRVRARALSNHIRRGAGAVTDGGADLSRLRDPGPVAGAGHRNGFVGGENVPIKAAPWSLSITPICPIGCRPRWPCIVGVAG